MINDSEKQINFDPMTGRPLNNPNDNPKFNQQELHDPSDKKIASKFSKLNKRLIIIVLIVILIIILSGIFIIKIMDNSQNNNIITEIATSKAFWIRNKSLKSAIFDIDGNQITDFNYTGVSDFINETSIAKNEKNEYGIISSNGKAIVEFGKYKYISDEKAGYIAHDKDNKHYWFNKKGKLIRPLADNEKVNSFVSENTFALLSNEKEYQVINYLGNIITTIPIVENAKSPVVNSEGNYGIIFYNNINYIINIAKQKVLLTLMDQNSYCISEISKKNTNEFILNVCNNSEKSAPYESKLIKNGKVVYSQKSNLWPTYLTYNENNDCIFAEGNDDYLLDSNGNKALKIESLIYKDAKNYIKKNGLNLDLYVDGKFKETINCEIEAGYAPQGIYKLNWCRDYDKGKTIFINYDGTKLNNENYVSAEPFKSDVTDVLGLNGYHYLINSKGEKISQDYKKSIQIFPEYNQYIAYNEDNTYSLIDYDGKEILKGESIHVMSSGPHSSYATIKNSDEYKVYDIQNKKTISIVNSYPSLGNEYFTTDSNGKRQYYSYTTGKMFYED